MNKASIEYLVIPTAPPKRHRKTGQKYIFNGDIRVWGRFKWLCSHNREVYQCKDCGTGYCSHGRLKHRCKDCGTGHCSHGRQKYQCKDCGTGLCSHGRWKHQCRDCGTGHCSHGRRKHQCKECAYLKKFNTVDPFLVSVCESEKRRVSKQ